MKKVLLISYNFLPHAPSFGSVSRCTYLLKFLKKNRIPVSVITAFGNDYGYFGNDWVMQEDIYYIPSFANKNKKMLLNVSGKSTVANNIKVLLKRWIKKLILELSIPDYTVLDIYRFMTCAREMLSKEKFTHVIVSAPPHGINLLVPYIKSKHPDLKLILEYRDSWNTQPIFMKNTRFGNVVSTYLEKKVLENCDHFVYVSPVVPELIKKKLGVDIHSKSTLIMNGYVSAKEKKSNGFVDCAKTDIGAYFGVINDFKNSYRSIDFVARLFKDSELKVDFYGHYEFEKTNLEEYDFFSYKGSIDHSDVAKEVKNYGFLLLVHTDPSSGIEPIPGKFFDYILARKPIVCLMPENNPVSKIISENSIGIVVDPSQVDYVDIKLLLNKLEFNSEFCIDQYSREYQFDKYLGLLSDT